MPPHPALSPETAVRERWGESASRAGKFRGRGNLFGAKSLARIETSCRQCSRTPLSTAFGQSSSPLWRSRLKTAST